MCKAWENYEKVATHLLNRFADEFGVDCFEGKQKVPGKSGTEWEIDAKGVCLENEGFLIVECRRYTTSKLNQEQAGELAFRIQDSGAEGGIFVTPLGLQEGAKKVASSQDIHNVTLSPNSTPHNFLMRFLNRLMVGVQSDLNLIDEASVEKGGPDDQ